ncbi:hypothetical protein CC2G_003693 [Coprinopsis cinerea AmutBmut pab1-1]|nr:hypothetical protein CC2G_003693 [Coprinopsis cinerea AmutBmut pab1-1]
MQAKVEFALDRVNAIEKRALRIVGDDPSAFYQQVFEEAVAGNAVDIVEGHMARFNRLTDKITRHRAMVLDISGVSETYRAIGDVLEKVDGIVSMLEDIYAYALEGLDVLQAMFRQGKLKYQALKRGRENA